MEMGCKFYVDVLQDGRVSDKIKLAAAHSMRAQMSSPLERYCNYAGLIPNHCMPDVVIKALSGDPPAPKAKKHRAW